LHEQGVYTCSLKIAVLLRNKSKAKESENMAVFRVEKNKGYTVMSNHHLRDRDLSLKAKGLLSQMLSLPEDWDFTLAGLSRINRESIDAIRSAIRELEEAGYITRSRERDEKGRLRGADYVIYEQPVSAPPMQEAPASGDPMSEKPTSENPTLENTTQLNKDISKTDLSKKEKINTDQSITDSIPFLSLNPSPSGRDEAAAQPQERNGKEKNDAYRIYEEIIKDNIEYDILIQNNRYEKERIDEIVDLILETVCSARKTIRIAGDDYPAELVKAKFMKLNSLHIEFVMDCLKENTTKIRNIRQYMDEFHLLLKEEQTAAYSVEIWKRFRKWGGIPTAITQNVKDLLSSREVENIFENSDFVLMLNQAVGDREILAKQLNISPQQMKYATHTEAGEGLIFYGNVVLPFVDRFPKDTELYRVMTTKPNEKFL